MQQRSMVVEPYIRTSRAEAKTLPKSWKLPAIAWPRELWSWETLGSVVAIILLTRFRLIGELAPFGLVTWAVAARDQTRRFMLYGIALLLAAVSTGDSLYALGLFFGMAVFAVLRTQLRHLRLPLFLAVGIASVFSLLPQNLPYLHPYDVVLAGMEVILAMMGAAIILRVYQYAPLNLSPGKHMEVIISWIVFSGLLLLALMQEQSSLALVADVIAKLIVLWTAFYCGPGLGAAAGALLGFLAGVQSTDFLWSSVLTFAGFFAGLCRHFGRAAAISAFLLATTALYLYLGGWDFMLLQTICAVVASVIFFLVPRLPRRMTAWLPALIWEAEDESEKVKAITAERIHDYGLVFRQLANAFLQVATRETESKLSATKIVDGIVERVCSKCSLRHRCWEKELPKTYKAILKVLASLESGLRTHEILLPDFLQKICRKKELLLTTISFLYELEKSGQVWHRRLQESKQVVTTQLAGLAEIMVDLAQDVRAGIETEYKIKNQYFHVELGIAQLAKGNQEVCGDYYSFLELRDGRQAFILSDGMGYGSRAQQESQTAVQLVEQLLLAGFRNDVVVRTVNTILQLRTPEETFTTLDILLVDTEKGEVQFLKTGAAPSFLRTKNRVKEVESSSPPVGILQEVELKSISLPLEDDSIIVMVTDGIFEVAPQRPDWLKQYLVRQSYTHPQVLADEILREACRLYGSTNLRDDLTVLVCRAKRLKHKIRDYMTV
ncbi:MAG: SpoIIE family protein phosphatase [Firmicutes bacterium]|nr:SpoIIE family protein phosphatase [Bacillota bacterium]